MIIIQFLLELAGATILLLFAVRMVRTGIERAFGASFRRLMTGSRARMRASLAGLALAATRARDDIRFSAEELAELRGMHDRVVANIALAGNVLVSGDVGIARRLLEEKGEFTHRQRKSRKSHLKRLARGRVESLEPSDLHLETGLAFKEFNSHIASIAYPILSREGQLLDSRLIAED